MALAPNPPICLLDLKTEFGDANGGNTCLLEYYAGGSNVPAGTTGTQGAIPSSGTLCLTDFPGSSNTSLNTWPTILPGPQTIPAPWGTASITNASFAQTFCNYAQQHDTSNSRLNHRWTTATSAAPSVFSYAYQNYTGLGSATFQAKAVYSVSSIGFVGTVENPQTGSPASNTWTNVSTSSYSPVWQWSITVTSGSGTRRLSGDVTFYMRALLNSTYYPNSTGYDSGTKTIELAATRGTQEPIGP